MHTLENKLLKISINPIGAELHSIYNKEKNIEHLWQGDPQFWPSRAPVLFPVIGVLKNNSYSYKGKSYEMPKHGFIRYNEDLIAEQLSDTKVSFALLDSDKTLKVYPFHFRFEITYELLKNQLVVSHHIMNTGKDTMYFNLGGHPAFNCPLYDGEKYTDYCIHLEKGSGTPSYILRNDGLISDQTINVLEGDKLKLTPTLFDKDALIFKNINASIATLCHETKGPVLSMEFNAFPDLGIWAKPKAPYVCIEPWLGYADLENTTQNLEEKEGIQQLAPKKLYQSSYAIIIH